LPVTDESHYRSISMGKYFIGWLLGVPAIVLVILYLIFGS
jgi:bacteriorhodopsin